MRFPCALCAAKYVPHAVCRATKVAFVVRVMEIMITCRPAKRETDSVDPRAFSRCRDTSRKEEEEEEKKFKKA